MDKKGTGKQNKEAEAQDNRRDVECRGKLQAIRTITVPEPIGRPSDWWWLEGGLRPESRGRPRTRLGGAAPCRHAAMAAMQNMPAYPAPTRLPKFGVDKVPADQDHYKRE